MCHTPDALWDARSASASCWGPRRHREGSTLCCPPAVVRLWIDGCLAVAVVDDAGRLIAGGDIPNTELGFVQLVDMFDTHQVLRVGIEGLGNFGRAVAVHLVLRWLPDWPVAVVEVPTLMTSRERRGQLGKGKTDPVDALAIA